MPISIKFDAGAKSLQAQILPVATPQNDGMMSAAQAAKLAGVSGGGKDVPVIVRFDPNGNSQQAAVIPDATPFNDGVMTKAQAAKLANLTPGGSGLVSITITPANRTVTPGTQTQYTAMGHFSSGPDQNLTSAVAWATSDGAIATFNADGTGGGILTSHAGGVCGLTATLSGVVGATGLTVLSNLNFDVLTSGAPQANNAATAGPWTNKQTVWVRPGTTHVTVRIRNFDMRLGLSTGVAIPGVDIAVGPSDGLANPGFGAVPHQETLVVPGDGTDAVSTLIAVTPPLSGQLLISYVIPNGSNVYYDPNQPSVGFWSTTEGSAYPLPGTMGPCTTPAFVVHVEQVGDVLRIVNVAGDSNSRGVGCTDYDQTYSRLLLLNDSYLVDCEGVSGSSLADWVNPAKPWFEASLQPPSAILIGALGTNDGGLLTDYQANVQTLCAYWRANGGRKIIWATIPPAFGFVSAWRSAANLWILSNPGGIFDATCDFDAMLLEIASPDHLDPPVNSGDGLHYNAVGHGRLHTGARGFDGLLTILGAL